NLTYGVPLAFLAEGNVEQSYLPSPGVVVEKSFKNMDKSPTNPMFSVWASMYDFGQKVQKAGSRKVTGTEKLLGYDCDLVELTSQEILDNVPLDSLVGKKQTQALREGRTKAWVIRNYGLPLRIEMYLTGQSKPLMTLAFKEFQINSGAKPEDF